MKNLVDYIKESLDIENFDYKFDVWFKSDKKHYEPVVNLLKDCSKRKVISKNDVENFLEDYPDFKVKNFVDFFDEDVKKSDDINVDYIYIFSKILETFINNFVLFNKLDYTYQATNNGEPNTRVDTIPVNDIQQNNKKEN